MKSRFDACMDVIFPWEGGYVNHPRDPGGETKYGISKRSYPSLTIAALTKDDARTIYRRDFWAKVRGDDLPAGIDLATLDPAINSGPDRGVRWMQAALGVPADGKMGPQTVAAARKANAAAAVKRACAARAGWLRGLKTWGTFGKGWSNRIAAIEAAGVRMALASAHAPVREALEANQVDAKGQAEAEGKRATAGGATGAAGTGGLTVADMPDWGIALAIAAIVLIVVIFLGRARHERARAGAYAKEAARV